MSKFLAFLTRFWRERFTFLVPLVLLPTFAMIYSYNTPATYTAQATIALESSEATSPLLENITTPEQRHLLEQTIRSARVVGDTLQATGKLLEGEGADMRDEKIALTARNIGLETFKSGDKDMMTLTYQSTEPDSITTFLETLTFNFVDELQAPERFSADTKQDYIQNQLVALRTQIKSAEGNLKAIKARNARSEAPAEEKLKSLAAAEVELEKLRQQEKLAKADFTKSLEASQSRQIAPVMRFIMVPTLMNPDAEPKQHLCYLASSILGALFISFLILFIKAKLNTAMYSDEEIRKELGLRIIGRMPDLGDVQIEHGRLTALPKMTHI